MSKEKLKKKKSSRTRIYYELGECLSVIPSTCQIESESEKTYEYRLAKRGRELVLQRKVLKEFGVGVKLTWVDVPTVTEK